tara:strand:- start:21834 stop:22490 length:657 start_codon:yes stop_codon:yes gene_type:complete
MGALKKAQETISTGGLNLVPGFDDAVNKAGRFVDQNLLGGAERDAAKEKANAADAAEQGIAARFAETKETLQPFITGGGPSFELQQAQSGALGPEAQAAAFANFQESPGTAFLREQGLRDIESGAGATGGLGGGDRLRELTQFSQGLALQDFGNQFNRLGSVTGVGLSAAQALGGIGGQAAQGQAQAALAGGQARAAGITGGANATRDTFRRVGAALA